MNALRYMDEMDDFERAHRNKMHAFMQPSFDAPPAYNALAALSQNDPGGGANQRPMPHQFWGQPQRAANPGEDVEDDGQQDAPGGFQFSMPQLPQMPAEGEDYQPYQAYQPLQERWWRR